MHSIAFYVGDEVLLWISIRAAGVLGERTGHVLHEVDAEVLLQPVAGIVRIHEHVRVNEQAVHAVHGCHVRGEQIPDLLGRSAVWNERREPLVRDQHQANCSRKRTSES